MGNSELKTMQKIELHCHLDGSLSKEFIEKCLQRKISEEELSVTNHCESLAEYLEKFKLPCDCLKEEKQIEEAGYDVLQTMSLENICYVEIRFAPLLLVTEKMNTEKVILSLLKGLERGKKDFGIEYNVITCAMRHHGEEENYQMLKTARQFLGYGVCAADLAGAEAQYPMSEFMELFRKVKKLDMPFTIHAGECGNIQNIIDAIEVGTKRIGHGIAMRGNREVQAMVRRKNIGIEMCPISNLQTKAVKSSKEYPIREFLDAGILVTINTDNRTVSNSSMTKELEFIQTRYEITEEECMLFMENAIKVSFANEQIKDMVYKKLKCK